ncbi:MAG: hypothetical protein HYT98_02220 [Candidatus Sungbacteria bacterium]|nr:hypothetical protein [Candidatus Sungbacteria bacterium]
MPWHTSATFKKKYPLALHDLEKICYQKEVAVPGVLDWMLYQWKVLKMPDSRPAELWWKLGLYKQGSAARKSRSWEIFFAGTIRQLLLFLLRFGNSEFKLKMISVLHRIWPRERDEGCSRSDIAEAYVFCLKRFPIDKLHLLADLTLQKYPFSARFDNFVKDIFAEDQAGIKLHWRLKEATFSPYH